MRLVLCSTLVHLFVLINAIDANEKPHIIVLGSSNSVLSRGSNARVSVSNDGATTTINTSFGKMQINNELVDPRRGYVVEGNDSLDASKCNSGELQKIILNCEGKLAVRHKTTEDTRKFSIGFD